jgi:hypothetical protein
MRKLTFLTAAMAILLFASLHSAASNSADEPVAGKYAKSASIEASMPVALKILTGKVVSVDHDARTLTVKKTGWLRAQEVMFAVDDAAATHLADLKQDDWVDITYAEADGKLIAKTIVKRIGEPSDT